MVQNASPVLNVLKKILEKQLDDLVASGERKDLYENPSWVYRQADNIGAIRTLKTVLSLLDQEEK